MDQVRKVDKDGRLAITRSDRFSGVVKWFSLARGYGYIAGNDGTEMLIRREAIGDGTFLTEGMRVTYVAVSDGDEMHAEHLRIAGLAPDGTDPSARATP